MEINILEEDSEYMYNFIQKIIDECGPRMPCSPQEAKSAEIIKKELEKTCDDVEIEPFKCHPRAALGWIKIVILMGFVSFSLFFLIQVFLESFWIFFLAALSAVLMLFALLITWEEFFCYKEFIDPLFKEKESQNVIGKIRPKKVIKKVIIFSGHHDSALQFNLLKYLKYGYPIVIFIGLGILFIWFSASIIFFFLALITFSINLSVIYGVFFNLVVWLLIIGIIPLILLLFFVMPGERANKVPGAVDNLSAIAIILGIGRYLKLHKDLIPENIEIRLISFGCEEAFLRGAYRYVETHLEELKKYNAECINLDAIQSRNDITFSNKEPTTRTIHSEEVVQKLINAAELVSVKAKIASLGGGSILEKIIGQIGGGTDAIAFSKSNIKASSITGLNLFNILQFYHQDTDSLDKIERGALEDTLKICIGYLLNESYTK
ncbi:MAG: M28 family peptidase [Candidatus Hermodarchaeota archaeon]